MNRPVLVLDHGSGFSKMGFSGNMEPSFVIPTAVALNSGATADVSHESSSASAYRASVAADLDLCVGEAALAASGPYQVSHPVQRGQVRDWDSMERLWLRSFYTLLRVDPQEHLVMLSEAPLASPQQREATAEIMFETFNVMGLHVAPQPVLAFMAANAAAQTPLTGVVVDAGHSGVSVVPVVEGFVIPGGAQSLPVGGAHLTALVQQLMETRGVSPPAGEAALVARRVKERFCYTCSDAVKEFGKHEREPDKYRRLWQGQSRRTAEPFSCEIGPERFLAAEALFSSPILESMGPSLSAGDVGSMQQAAAVALALAQGDRDRRSRGSGGRGSFGSRGVGPGGAMAPLPELVDLAIQSAPIDTRRALYKTVVLSGGSSLFKDFGRRLQRDVKKLVDARQSAGAAALKDHTGSPMPQKQSRAFATTGAVDVSVVSHQVQEYAVWFGGSIVASTPSFPKVCHMREQYAEYGPNICRSYAATVNAAK